jgi:5-methylcytosine-specific restriction endonuclease McrA
LAYKYAHYDKVLEAAKRDNKKPSVKKAKRKAAKEYRERGDLKKWQNDHKDRLREYEINRKNKQHKISKQEWEQCKKYFNNSCAYCGISEVDAKEQQHQNLHKEHVIYDGANDLSNCVPACKSCNSQKWKWPFEEWYNVNNLIFNEERLKKIIQWTSENYKKYIKE